MAEQVDVQHMADNLSQGTMTAPGGIIIIEVSSVGILDLPAGRAVLMRATVQGHEARLVMLPKATVVWIVTLETAGSSRAQSDFQRALSTLTLP